MFDIGFSELMVLAVVALIVVGPERLPKVARTLGHLLGRFQRYVSDVKSDIDRELRLEEMKKLREEVEMQARRIESQAASEVSEARSELAAPVDELSRISAAGERLDFSPPAVTAEVPATLPLPTPESVSAAVAEPRAADPKA
jgi:sec-independent protein translocase protein TatB